MLEQKQNCFLNHIIDSHAYFHLHFKRQLWVWCQRYFEFYFCVFFTHFEYRNTLRLSIERIIEINQYSLVAVKLHKKFTYFKCKELRWCWIKVFERCWQQSWFGLSMCHDRLKFRRCLSHLTFLPIFRLATCEARALEMQFEMVHCSGTTVCMEAIQSICTFLCVCWTMHSHTSRGFDVLQARSSTIAHLQFASSILSKYGRNQIHTPFRCCLKKVLNVLKSWNLRCLYRLYNFGCTMSLIIFLPNIDSRKTN